ncbi:metalloregulator ArsR/SmtB family transcription factor, partial [candidate division KSB1 bacterium]|nr:metalloregulator ArsR/SmtB family transcription factor [candidate division KSB1 bacterium]
TLRIMKALADSSRLLIIRSLFDKPQYVEELAERLNLSASTVSFHLKKLEEARLVKKIKKQYYADYEVNEEIFTSRLLDLISFDNAEKCAQDERVRQYREKVLRTFIVDGVVVKMPAQLKKRLIILSWFADKFERDKNYREEEVSALIQQYYPDYCLVRRDLVDFRFMRREKQIYQRLKRETE